MTALDNMNDVAILTKKNGEITRLKLIQAGLIIVIILLAVVIAAIALLSRFSEPTATPSIDVITREPVNGRSCDKLLFPKKVVAGESFQYKTCGQKLVEADATVTYQMLCEVNGSNQTTPLGSVYSDYKKGTFDRTVSATIPVSTRIENSKKCRYTSIPTYTFYQVDQGGNQRDFEVKEPIESTEFELVVPEDAVQQLSQTSSAPAKQSDSSSPQQVATTSPTGGAENKSPSPTTSGGSGGDGNPPKKDEEPATTNRPIELNVDLPLLPPIQIGLGTEQKR